MLKIVRVKREASAPNLNNLLLIVAIFGSSIIGTVVATYPSFFLFNPLESMDAWRVITLTLTSVGWLTLFFGPLLVLALNALGKSRAVRFLPWVALAWPVALIINHLALLIQTHKLFLGYLFVYPVFMITDILLPLVYLAIYSYLKRSREISL
jgi:hypothetical protein